MARMSLMKNYAPKCCHPDCNNIVSYHEKYIKKDGTLGAKLKQFCEYHRTDPIGRASREIFLKSRNGCENRNGLILGKKCNDPDTPSLTIDHFDGNKHNTSDENLVVLCANCHNEKTKRNGDTRQRYSYMNTRFFDLFEEK